MTMFVGALVINATPSLLKPVSGTLISWLCNFKFRQTLKLCRTTIMERLENTKRAIVDPSFDWTPPVIPPFLFLT